MLVSFGNPMLDALVLTLTIVHAVNVTLMIRFWWVELTDRDDPEDPLVYWEHERAYRTLFESPPWMLSLYVLAPLIPPHVPATLAYRDQLRKDPNPQFPRNVPQHVKPELIRHRNEVAQ